MTLLPLVLSLITFILRHTPRMCVPIPVQPSSENSSFTSQDLHPISPQPRRTDQSIPSDRAQISQTGYSIAFKIDSFPY
jgi:hypothetical protein